MEYLALPQNHVVIPRTDVASVPASLGLWAARTPDRTAYLFLSEGEEEQDRLTYAALDARARAIAAALGRSFQPGERALLVDPPGLDFIAAFFGCLYAGLIAVPAYPPRSQRRMPRLLAILADAQPAVALASSSSRQRVRGWLERTPGAAALSWLATDELETPPAGWQPAAPEGGAVAFLQYTSGSTSTPKGVMVTHDNLLHNQILIREACGHSERSVFVSWLPPYHDLGLIGNLLQAVFVGGSCVLMAPTAFLQRPARWLEAVSRYGATTSGGPNFAWDLCVRKVSPEQRRQLDLSRWEVAFNGAEPVRAETLAAFAAAFAECGFRPVAFYPCYGLAEATLMVSGGRPGEEPAVRSFAAEGLRRLVSCGAVLGGQELAIVDPATGERRGPGEVGEIWLSGPSVAAGYWNRPDETAEAFGACLQDGTGPFLRTGDLGCLQDGELFIAGRLKDLIILRGRNVYPQDIELTAELSHPALQPGSTAAFAMQVDGEERLAVMVERRPRSRPDLGEGIESVAPAVRRAVAEEHEIQVHAVVLVPPGTVLKTSSGKVQRRACRELFLAGQMESLGVSCAGEDEAAGWTGEAPGGEDLPAYLRQEAGRVLKTDPARIPARQPLTALGLDSLGAIELEQRITDRLGIELPASGLLEGASLDDLTERVLAVLPTRTTALAPRLAVPGQTETPLSAMQKALWFEQQLTPESPAYNIPFAARLGAGVDTAALRHALEALVARHAPLRSVMAGDVQRFVPEAGLAFTERDVSGEAELQAAVAAESHQPFDLDRGPLFRAVLFTGPQEDRVLLLVVHHIAFDGWSLWVLLDELRLLYEAAVSGREASLPALPAEYADFVLWQEEMLAGPAGERLWDFWRAELPQGMPPLQLPADRQATGPTWTGATHGFPLDPELIGQLRGLAREEGTTLYAVLLATWQGLLSRSTAQPEVVVGAAVSGRSRPEFRDLVGCLFNTVPLKADLAGNPTFRELLRQVRGRLASALAHQDYPSHLLAERLQPGRAGRASFFQTLFLFQKPHRWEAAPRLLPQGGFRLDLGSLVLDALFVDQEAARSPLELEVFEADEAVAAWFRYSTALFDTATVERLASRFTILLTEAVRGADRPISDLPLLDAAERDLLLREWSSTGREYPSSVLIHDLFREQAARTPDKVAAICQGEAVLYRELDERSGRLARRLAGLDGGLVGLMVEPDHPLLVGMLGILKAGKGFVPLDPGAPTERLERMAADCGLAVLATDRRHLAKAQELAVPHVVCLDGDDLEPPTAAGGVGEGIAYVIFTSGSTGVPKGVPITHENLVPLLLWSREVFGFGEHTRVLQSLSYAFDFGVFEILTTLLFGGTLVLRGAAERSDIEAYLEQVRRHRINTLHTTPSFFRAVTLAAQTAGECLDQLEVLHLGGEALSEGLVEEAFAVSGAECRLFNGYGPTEASVNCVLYEVGRAAGWCPRGLASVPIGHPSAANRLYVLDRWMQPVPVGGLGELFVGGVGLSRGYLNRPDLTAARFVPSPFGEPGARLYRTGDLVRFHADGAIEFLGRVDNQVKVRGYRIELEEIEAALAAHPEVGACAVVAWRPEGDEARLVAYAAPRRPEIALDSAELRRFLGRTLPAYMVPAAFRFLPELPLSTSGKVDRRALPPLEDAQPAVPDAAPRTPLETALAAIWSRSLGVEKVGIHDDFFELGGHSLLGTRIIAQIRKELGVEVALRTFFEASTITELARAVEGAGRVDLPPIRPVPRDGELPLSFAQERIWFLTQLNPDLRSYFVPRALRVRGRFDPALVEATFSEINRRHEILRTTFPAIDGRPVQVIHPPFRMSMPVVDLSALPVELREEEMRRRILVEGRRSFDLARGPLLRLTLLRLANEEHTLVITEHHLVHDGWTQGVLLKDFLTLYAAFSRGEPSPLPELPVQYADFAVWQRLWLRDEVLDTQLSWWKERLAGAPTLLELPTDRPRPAVQSFRGDQVTWVLPADLSRELRTAGRRLGATLFMSMLSAWDTLMMRLSGQEDLCIGTGVANRRVVEAEGLLGMVINTLVLRADLSGSPTFAELVARMREVCVGAYGHQDLPFEKLVNALRPERSLSHTPLFQVFFAFLDTPMPELEIPGLSIGVLDAHNRSAKFDINVTVLLPSEQRVGMEVAREDEITLLFEYSTDLFERTTVLRMLERYQRILEAAVADPELRLWDLPLLSSADRWQAVVGWNETWTAYPRASTIQKLFEAQVDEAPEAVAVVGEGATWSYRQLNLLANRLAHHLCNRGVGAEDRVGVCLDRSPELIATVLGILKAGGVYVPLDPSYPAERLRFMLDDSGVRLVVSREPLIAELPLGSIRVVDLDRDAGALARQSGENPPPAGSADHLAYVMYTSGSTGVPKGVAVTHRAVVRLVHGTSYMRLGAAEVFLQLAPISFDASTFEIWGALLHGARLAVFPSRTPSLGELGTALEHQGVTTLWLTAGLFHQMMHERPGSLAGVRQLLAGGDVLLPAQVRRALEELPGCTVINGYGPTENTTFTCCRPLCDPQEVGVSVPIGRPIANTRAYLLDRGLQPVPVGVPGELFAGGDGLARGYLGRPALTAERFVPDPFGAEVGAPGGRLYRTGDLARRRLNGDIEFLGRIDQQVKVRGFRVELGEIEAHLARHPAVQAAAAAIYEAAPGDRRIAAYLVAASQPAPTADELRHFLIESLPEYMVPSAWIWLAALPLTPNGKLDRKALPQPETERPELTVAFVAPRTDLERRLAAIWSEVLGTDEVGVHDNFFDLGGHSLLGTRLMARIESRLGIALPLRALFEAPTVAALAGEIEQTLGGEGRRVPPLVASPRPAEIPLSFAQERLWFIDQLNPGTPLYNIPVALRVEGPLDAALLALCLGEVRRRHESLRTVFARPEGTPVQVIQPAAPFAFPVVDLSGLPQSRREAAAFLLAGDEAALPFDLARGPLLRGLLLRLTGDDHVAALTLHHIVSDGWSMSILIREVVALYAALAAGRPSPLPELPVQSADFSLWQRSWLTGEALDDELSFWRRQLAGLPPLLTLPTDRPRPAVQSFRGASWPVRWTAELNRQIQALGRREGATLFMVLLAAFQALLARTSGQDDLAVGTPVAGRNRVEIEGLIGFFVNTLVLRGDLAGPSAFRELLGRVRETALAVHAHQDVPFEKLVQELSPERSLAHSPLFQVLLALQNTPVETLEIQDLRLRPARLARTTAKFDLLLNLEERSGELHGTFEYATDLFDATTIDRLIGCFERLLAEAVAAPERSVWALPLLSSAEREQILIEWNDTAPVPAPAASLHELFEAQARRAPEAVALVAGGREILYRELDQAASRLAGELRRRGAGPETVVGVCLERSAGMVAALLGILKSGAAYLPLDPRLPCRRLEALLTGARVSAVVSEPDLAPGLPWSDPVVLLPLSPPAQGDESGDSDSRGLTTGPDHLAYVLYTSGSTGAPKGVAITHRSAVELVRWAGTVYAPEELCGVLASTSLSFDLSVFELFVPLAWGGTVILARDVLELPALLSSGPAAGRVTLVNTVPSAMAELVEAGSLGASVRTVNLAGEPLPRALADRLYATGTVERVWNLYGPSEATTYSTFARVPREGSAAPGIGRPITATEAYVLAAGAEPLPVPIGVPGELYLGGAGLARGYLHRPELTAERFIPDPFGRGAGGRLYRTGDLVRRRGDGALEFLGRLDQQVKIRGFRIELGEIEAALGQHPAVREAAVVARGGAGGSRLVAYWVPESGGAAAPAELREHLQRLLPEHMVPAAWVSLDRLPLTPNGKIDRKALPDPVAAEPGSGEEPRSPAEEIVAGIWAQVLEIDRVGCEQSFFDLGGHSLLATRVVARMRDAFGVDLPVRTLFVAPTVRALAAAAERARAAGAGPALAPLVPEPRGELAPVSPAQERMWFLERFAPGPVYNLPVAVRLEGSLAVAALAAALGEIVWRHEALRTTFVDSPEGVLQRVGPPPPPFLPVVDLESLPPAARADAGRRLAAEAARQPFDLARGPLVRAALLRSGPEDHLLVLSLHHIVADGWSLGVFTRELGLLYEALRAGRPSPLLELPLHYADYALWQRRWLAGDGAAAALRFWTAALAGLPVLDLPTDRPRPPEPSFRGSVCRLLIPPDLTGRLVGLSRGEGATLFMVLLAGFTALLTRLTGGEDLPIGAPVANRTRPEVEGLVGLFVNTLVLRAETSGDPAFAGLLRRVRETCLAAYAHQDLPFERLVEALQPERHLDRTPLFQVALALQNTPFETVELPGLSWRPLSLETGTARFDLTLFLAETAGGLTASLELRSDLFDPTTAGRLLSGFATLLTAAVADPARRIGELPLLAEAARQALLVEWNATAAAHPQELCLHELVEAQVDRTPGAVAVSFEGEDLTYRDLDRRANQLARHLRSLGVGPEVKVGIAAERSLDLVVGLLAILKAGGAYVPIDPAYPEERLAYMLADARVPVLLTRSRIAEAFAARSAERLGTAVAPDNLAYMIYTSGSTGRPKGAMNTHRAIVNRLLWMQAAYGLDASDRVLQKTPFSFDVSVWEFFWPLLVGARLVVARPGGHQDSAYLVRLIGEQEVTTLHFVPSMLAVFLDEPDLAPCRTLRRVIASGEALSLSLQERFFARLEGSALHNLYGPTEAAVDVTSWACAPGSGRRSVPIGRPIDNLRIHILDPGLRPVPVGVAGHLHIGGVGLARGYHARPGLTAERFLPDPVGSEPGARLYATGDLACHLADGAIEYLGRIDHQVKLRGFRIELGEIEAVLRESPLVADAVVAGIAAGTDHARLAAYIVPDPERALPVRNLLRLQREGRLDGLSRTELPNGWTVLHRSRAETDFVYREIFEERIYLKHGVTLADGDVVFDVGANIGMFSLFAGSAARDVTVFAFEPIPQVHAVLAANAELHGLDVRAFPCGLAEEARRDRFTWYEHNSIVSGRYADAREEREVVRSYERGRRGDAAVETSLLDELLAERMAGQEVEVELKTLSQVIREIGVERIDLLKIDVEKSERDVLLGIAPGDWPKIRQIAAEVHDIDGRVAWVRELLEARGFAVAVEQEAELGATPIHAVWAVRPEGLRAAPQASPRALCGSPGRLLAELRVTLAAKLPEHMVPSVFIPLEALPLSPNGKVDRKALPDPVAAEPSADGEPRSPAEEIVAGIWAQVLKLDRVGCEQSFFDLGGHSLLATRVVARMREAFGVDLPVRTVFAAPTVRALAAAAEQARAVGAGPALAPLVPEPRGELSPVSPAQERMWFLERLEPGPVHNLPVAVRLQGHLAVAALAAALAEIVRRHEGLRATFVDSPEGALQRVGPPPAPFLPVVDLAALPPALRADAGRRLADEEAHRLFDLARGPLLRAALLRSGPADHILLLTLHHIAADGWSRGVFTRELKLLYGAFRAGRPSPLPELPLQYTDYALWQRRWLAGDGPAATLRFWTEALAGLPVLDLPTDRPRPTVQSFRGAGRRVLLPPALAGRLAVRSRAEGATLFMVLLSGLAALLARLTGQADVPVGSPVANRSRPELEGLVGLFLNTLVLRADVSGDPGLAGLLGRVRETCLAAYAQQDLPFEKLVETLRPERDMSRNPLFQVMLILHNFPQETLELEGLRASPMPVEMKIASFDLLLELTEEHGGLAGSLEYDTDLFDAPTAERIAAHLEQVLWAWVRDPGRRLSSLPLLTPAERCQVLLEWNPTPREAPSGLCIHHLIEAQVARAPEALAVVRGASRLTYRELNEQANRLGHHLRRLGVGPEARVGIFVERSPALVVSLLAVLKAGGAYVPLDPSYPADRVAYMAEDARVRVIVAGAAVEHRLPGQALAEGVHLVRLGADQRALEQESAANPDSGVRPENLSYVIYTSGSTGRPKGVAIQHCNAVTMLSWALSEFDDEESAVVLLATSISFDVSVLELFFTLARGSKMVVAENILELPYLPEAGEVTMVNAVPSAMAELLRTDRLPPSVLTANVGGEAVPRWLVDKLYSHETIRTVRNASGPSEATSYATLHPIDRWSGRIPPLGRPAGNTRMYVLDAHRELLPVGVPGELHVGGLGVSRGYLDRPGLTAERFLPDPFVETPGARMYRVGDIVRLLPDGQFEFLGRIDHQVKVRGFRIELGEIEEVLLGHPSISEAAVVVREETSGDKRGDKRIVAYLTAPAGPVETSALRRLLAEKLPDSMIPSVFEFLDVLPKTPSGKIDRKSLPEPAARARPKAAVPRTEAERRIADIWREVLGVEPDLHDNFFDLGGHSLLVLRAHRQLQAAFGREIPLMEIFLNPTVASLGEHLAKTGGRAPSLEKVFARAEKKRQMRKQIKDDETRNA
jgi:amino acid adenylation domain-containing protein/FkbM family methyltransferase